MPTADVQTPFVSSLHGHDYAYNADKEEPHTFIQFIAIHSDVEVPSSVTSFIVNAVKPFAKELHDVIIGPTCMIAILTLDENSVEKYYNFCHPGKHRLPNTDCFLQASTCYMNEVISDINGDSYLSSLSDSDIADSFDESSSESSADETKPSDPGQRKGATESILKPSSRSASSTQPALSQPTDTAVPETPAATPLPQPTLPALPETPSRETLSTRSERNKQQQQQLKRRARARFSRIDFSKLDVVVPKRDFLTVLFRPTNPDESFNKENPYKITEALTKLGGVPLHTRNIRDGGLAADFDPATPPEPLLQASLLMGKPVSASLPKVSNSCAGVLTGVHWEIADEQISADLRTEPPLPILAVKRLAKPGQQSWTVKVTFQGTVLPSRAYLEGRSHKIRPYETKPLQCFNCGRYSHTARVCRSKTNCWTCSEPHPTKECPNKATPKCGNCGGSHPADHASCPTRSFQAKICQVKATENVPFRAARDAVSKAAKSYAAAVSSKPVQKEQRPAATPNFIPNVAHPRPPQQQQQTDLTVLFNGLIAILTAAASNKDFSGALTEVMKLFKANSPNPDLFQLPGSTF